MDWPRRACWRPHDVRDAARAAGAAGHPGDRRHPSVPPALSRPSRRRPVPLADRPADAGRRRQDRQAADHDEPDPGMPGRAGARAHPGRRAPVAGRRQRSISSCCSTTPRRWRRSTRAAKARATARCGACSPSSIARRAARGSRSSRAASVRRCSPVRPRSPSKRGPRWTTWKPEAPHHSLALGLRLARELAGRTGRLMVVSDVAAGARGEATSTGVSGCRSASRSPTSASPLPSERSLRTRAAARCR